ncbi:MAG TPA: hydrolase [Smithellaceae bacterium]|nr:hydrolase [Smithellaceae bacterium]
MVSRTAAVLIVIDIQGNLAQAMLDKENLFASAVKMIRGAHIFNLPVIATEQIPEKLGRTIPQINAELNGGGIISKESFSCWGSDIFRQELEAHSRRQAIVLGIETHVCVYQTVLDLIAHGYDVHVVADAVSSRTAANRSIGLARMQEAGAHITSTETVLFEMLRTAADSKFKDVYKIVK